MNHTNLLLFIAPLIDSAPSEGHYPVLSYLGVAMIVYGVFCFLRLVRIYPWVNRWRDYNLEAIETPGMPMISLDSIPSPFCALNPMRRTEEDMVRDREGFERLRAWAGL